MSIRNSIFMTLLAAALLTACDNIPVSDRTTPLDASSFKKPVVVVDFTGVDCTNCPKAAKVLSSMHEQVGDKIIGIARHIRPQMPRSYRVLQGFRRLVEDSTAFGYGGFRTIQDTIHLRLHAVEQCRFGTYHTRYAHRSIAYCHKGNQRRHHKSEYCL